MFVFPLTPFAPLKSLSYRRWKVLLIGLLLAGIALPVAAQVKVEQLTDAQIQQFIQRAQASGLTEAQIEQAATAQGFSPEDIAKMRERIANLQGGQPGSKKVIRDSSTVRRMPSDLKPRRVQGKNTDTDEEQVKNRDRDRESDRVPDETPKRLKPEEREYQKVIDALEKTPTDPVLLARRDSLEAERTPDVFGMALFANANLSFEPNLRIPTPMNYVLGPDDELVVEIFGNASYTYKLKVSPEGTVRIENLAPIVVSGLTIEQAQTRIVGRLRQAYAGLNRPGGGITAQVSLGNIRSIQVTITGEVVKPGTYTVASLATAFNALYEAGGPSENGSFRNIQVVRGNRVVRTIDLYDFLLRADQKDNILLQDGDVIRVPDYLTHVEMAGEVRRPMLYEVKRGESLRDVLQFAGGFTDRAYTASLTLRRNTPRERRVANVAQEELPTFVPQSGDKVFVGKILNRYENRVQVEGAVFRPGAYALEPGTSTVRELLRKAEGLREDAFLNRALIQREGANLETETISFDLGKVLRGEVPDIPLRRQDVVLVRAVRDLREKYTITINGAVNKPGEYGFADSLRVADLVVMAGGFTEAATPTRLEVARRVKGDTTRLPGEQSVLIYRFDIDKQLRLGEQDARFVLRPFDVVFVRTDPRYEAQKQVILAGEVRYPGPYAIRERSERITDLIERAGGLRPEAFLRAARFWRKTELVAVDLREILEHPDREANLLLRDGDSLVIPKKTELVRIQGAVLNPATVNYETSYSLKDYISEAGGFTNRAIPSKVYVIYANGSVDRTHKVLFFNRYPRMEAGSTIIVPARPEREGARLSPGERVGLYSLMGSLAIALATVLSRLFP